MYRFPKQIWQPSYRHLRGRSIFRGRARSFVRGQACVVVRVRAVVREWSCAVVRGRVWSCAF